MMLEAGLILSRFLHYASATFLFGAALYPLYGFTTTHGAFVRALKPWLIAGALVSLLSLIGWFLFSAGTMADDAHAMFDRSVLLTIITTMSFGKLWVARLALSVLLIVLALGWPNGTSAWWTPFLSAILLVSLAGTGHAQEPEHPYMAAHYLADGAHLLAAGAWLGALWPLAIALRNSQAAASDLLVRFSWMGQISVSVLLASGLVNSWFLVGSVGQLLTTFYGRLLCIKIGAFLGMLMFAAMNRFWITPIISASMAAEKSASLRKRLMRSILAEQGFGLLVLGAVSWLGMLQPPVTG